MQSPDLEQEPLKTPDKEQEEQELEGKYQQSSYTEPLPDIPLKTPVPRVPEIEIKEPERPKKEQGKEVETKKPDASKLAHDQQTLIAESEQKEVKNPRKTMERLIELLGSQK